LRATHVIVSAAIAALFLVSISTSNPPGFHRDESDIAFNAATIAHSGRDEHGAHMPLYFSSAGDWKSGPYIYLLAGVFAVTGPGERAALGLSATLGLLVVAVLGLLGFRLTRRASVGFATAALAAATPWIFEVSRLVFEVALEPLLIATLVLVVAEARAQATWSIGRCAALGLLLGLIGYAYAGGRVLAPLLALSLLVFVTRERWRSIAVTWAAFAIALLPMAVFALRHPHALFARYNETGATKSVPGAVATVVVNFVHAASPWQWLFFGDRNPRHHVQGSGGSLLVIGAMLAVGGAAVVIARRRFDPFWAFVGLGAVASVVPAALISSHPHALRAIGLPVFMVALAIPAFEYLREHSRERRWRIAALALAVGGIAQFAVFQTDYWRHGAHRLAAFDAQFPAVFREAVETGRPVMLVRSDYAAVENGLWYARLWRARVGIVEHGEHPRAGSVVVTTYPLCPTCRTVDSSGSFRAYVAD
jgi:hypothetical protein